MAAEYLRYCLGRVATACLPRGARYRLAQQVADWRWRHCLADRAAVCVNLTAVLGHPVPPDAPVVRQVFRNFGMYLVELAGGPGALGRSMTVHGGEQLPEFVRAHPATILLSAHIGNWELAGMAIAKMGIPLTAVALPHADARVTRLFDAQRLRAGLRVILMDRHATRRCLAVLRAGAPLGLIGDRVFGHSGVLVEMFGEPALLPAGPAILSVRTGAPVVPAFLIREGRDRLRLDIGAPMWPGRRPASAAQQAGTRGIDDGAHETQMPRRIRQLTQQYADVIASKIRQVPDQWMMMQPFPHRFRAADAGDRGVAGRPSRRAARRSPGAPGVRS